MLLSKWFYGSVSQEITILVDIMKLNFLESVFEYTKIVTNILILRANQVLSCIQKR